MGKTKYALHDNRHVIRLTLFAAVVLVSFLVYGSIAFGAPASVKTSLEMVATGSEPFNTASGSDTCSEAVTFDSNRTIRSGTRMGASMPVQDGNNGAGKEGQDACSTNDIVRIGDNITYQIEVSNNDAAVDYLLSTVELQKYSQSTGAIDANGTRHQEWTQLPEVCLTGDNVTAGPTSELKDTDSDGKADTLVCNLGFAREGRAVSYTATARVLPVAADGTTPTLNDSVVGATASAQSESTTALTGSTGASPVVTTGASEAVVTASFSVNLVKEMLGYEKKADGTDVWPRLVAKKGSDGTTDGYLVEFRVAAQYAKGSMIANSANEAGGDYTASYTLFDAFTDDSTTNNGALSSGMVLYSWDSNYDACKLQGNHGTSAAVACTQPNNPVDAVGPNYATDGVNDPNIRINLTGIDTRDPDGNGSLFTVRVGLWLPKSEVDGHQSCSGANAGNPCVLNYLNHVQGYNTTTNTMELFNPSSTEDANGANIVNNGGAPEVGGIGSSELNTVNSDNMVRGQFDVMPTGYFSWRMTHNRTIDTNSNPALNNKRDEQLRARGQSVPLVFNIYEARGFDKMRSQVCNKIDTSQYTFVGIPEWNRFPEWPNLDGPMDPRYDEYGVGGSRLNGHIKTPFPAWIDDGTSPAKVWTIDATQYIQSLYSATPNGTGSLQDLDETLCEDDVTGDGIGNIMLKDGTQTNPGNPVDWYEDYNAVPGGPSSVTKVRMQLTVDNEKLLEEAQIPSVRFISVSGIYELRIRNDATGYGSKNYLPNFADARTTSTSNPSSWLSWIDGGAPNSVFDPASPDFSYNIFSADRNILVDSAIDLQKETVPKGIKVANPGQVLTYQLTPELFGQWTGSQTATMTDDVPTYQRYLAGTERFSVDGGATWMTRAEYDASSPAVTITSSPVAANADPAVWEFASVDQGDQLPMIRYQLRVVDNAIAVDMNNTATLSAPSIAADKPITDTDSDGVADTGDGVGDDAIRRYRVRVLPRSGLDVQKTISSEVYETGAPFTTDLTYRNLSSISYANTEIIDILPYNNESTAVLGGDVTPRTPATDYKGITRLDEVRYTNGEQVYVTSVLPGSLSSDPCAASNLPDGYVPAQGDLCYRAYAMNNNTLPGGAAQGSGLANWQACTMSGSPLNVATSCPIDPTAITAVKVVAPAVNAGASYQVGLTISPIGNVGGVPVLMTDAIDATKRLVDWANSPQLGDRYTNSFSARTQNLSLLVTSNDVTVTAVSGTISGTVWWDENSDGAIATSEVKMPTQQMRIVDAAGDPLYRDAASGAVVTSSQRAQYEATGRTVSEYVVTTGADGAYSFAGLPSGSYTVSVVNPPSQQTFDLDDGTAATNHQTVATLSTTQDASGTTDGVSSVTNANFGYSLSGSGSLAGMLWIDTDGNGSKSDSEQPLANVSMTVTSASGLRYTIVTDANGAYSLQSIPYGTYTVEIDSSTIPEALQQSYDVDGTNDARTEVVVSADAPSATSRNFAYSTPPATPVEQPVEDQQPPVQVQDIVDNLAKTGVNGALYGGVAVVLLAAGVIVRRKML